MKFELDTQMQRPSFFSGGVSIWLAAFAAAALFLMGGCARMMNGLRGDSEADYAYERGPTMGGRFMEGGFLDPDLGRSPAASVAERSGRSPSEGRIGGQGSWLAADSEDGTPLRRPSYVDRPMDRDALLPERPVMQQMYKNGHRASRADFIDDSSSDGSLWSSDGQTNYFLTKNQVKTQGDLISIVADDEFIRDVAAELKRTMTPEEREAQMDLAQERARRVAMGLPETDDPAAAGDAVAATQSSADRAPADQSSKKAVIPQVKWSQVDLRKSMELKAGDTVMTEVLERYPNGNYKIRGLKRVRIDGQVRMVSVVAIARNTDIGADESVPAGKLYEYRIESVR